ncbi:MAG: hypothetical protein ACKV0T_16825, partial [Planctomycetales bacterium]
MARQGAVLAPARGAMVADSAAWVARRAVMELADSREHRVQGSVVELLVQESVAEHLERVVRPGLAREEFLVRLPPVVPVAVLVVRLEWVDRAALVAFQARRELAQGVGCPAVACQVAVVCPVGVDFQGEGGREVICPAAEDFLAVDCQVAGCRGVASQERADCPVAEVASPVEAVVRVVVCQGADFPVEELVSQAVVADSPVEAVVRVVVCQGADFPVVELASQEEVADFPVVAVVRVVVCQVADFPVVELASQVAVADFPAVVDSLEVVCLGEEYQVAGFLVRLRSAECPVAVSPAVASQVAVCRVEFLGRLPLEACRVAECQVVG